MSDIIAVAETAALGPVGAIWAKVSPYLVKGALILTLAGALFISGCEYRVRQDLKAAAAIPAAQVVATVAAHNAGVQKTITIYKEDLAHVRALEADKAVLATKLANLKDLVNLYVPQSPNGPGLYVSPCAVGLLNSAASGAHAGDPDTSAALATCKDTGAGSLTWSEFVRREIDLRGQYNSARDQSNALIDWVQDHVVNATPGTTEPSKTAPN